MIINTKDYLAHHGIAGQKWGVRRYQNEDGSLTPEGYDAVQDLFDNNDIFGWTQNMGASYVITNPKKSIKEVKK